MTQLREGMLADGLDASGGFEYLRQPTDLVVLGRIQLTPAALAIQVGVDDDSVCFGGGVVKGAGGDSGWHVEGGWGGAWGCMACGEGSKQHFC
jgi:hypothetical protein